MARRMLEGLLTAWAAVSLTFFSLRLAAGDPVASLLSQGLATPEQAKSLRHSLGLDAPLLLQYFRYLGRLIQGNLGVSLYTQRPVSEVILEQLPNTAQLAMQGLLLAILLGLILGLASAWLRNAAGRLARPVGSQPGWIKHQLAGGLPRDTHPMGVPESIPAGTDHGHFA